MKIDGKNLFPIHSVFTELKAQYFMAADGTVFSNARGKLVRLLGSHSFRKGLTFSFQARGHNKPVSITQVELERRCKYHSSFRMHTQESTGDVMTKTKSVGGRNHAGTTEEGIKAKGSIIGRVHKGHLVFGSEPKIHTSEESVKSEMQRLALEHPGVKFVELKIGKSVVAGGVTWE